MAADIKSPKTDQVSIRTQSTIATVDQQLFVQ